MKRMRVAPRVELDEAQRKTLSRWARGRSTPARLVTRAKIVLFATEGKENQEIAAELGVTRRTVGRWRTRFVKRGLAGIEKDAPRGGRKPRARNRVEAKILKKTTQERPRNATHWSTRSLAEELGVSHSMVHRVWKASGLKPHLVKRFKLSNDPRFVEKLKDVVGLYLNPPEHALVLSVDEKSQIQALDRTQPSLPLYKGRLGTMTHDYKRNGTTTLFAALELAEGSVIAACMPRHRHQEWLKFLKLIDEQTPKDLDLHLIVDNYATHKHERVQHWLRRRPRFHIHFIPTSSSWLNLVERFFRDLTDKRIRRGAFKSVHDLIVAILGYIHEHNQSPRPFVWTAKADKILEKVRRARLALDKVTSG
jgi:transposase